jgi:hypothetical protein
MNTFKIFVAAAISLGLTHGQAMANDEQVIAALPMAKITLLEGIREARVRGAEVISAKFEMDDSGKLSLSIYTAPLGLGVPAEANPMTELSGDPTALPFAASAEVFADKEHIARASTHLAIMQLSRMSLAQIIGRALYVQRGIPYSVANPSIRNQQPVADVFIVGQDGKSVRVTVNVQTGQVSVSR